MVQPGGENEGPAPAEDDDGSLSVERLVFFTDAVVAIAMTLLILPLMEAVAERSWTAEEFLDEHGNQVLGFLISFAVIAAFWVQHNRIFGHVRNRSGALVILAFAWMLTVVVMPVTTALTFSGESTPLQAVLYIGTMAMNTFLSFLIANLIRRDPRVGDPERPISPRSVAAPLILTVLCLAALLIAVLVPAINYYALLVLNLTPLLTRRVPDDGAQSRATASP